MCPVLPTRIGKYSISGVLGEGGFGTVYRAYDSMAQRDVAIKVLKGSGDPAQLNRFKSEAVTAANLRHPNIVTIYEFGETDGFPFLVMEYLDGQTLAEIIAAKTVMTLLEKVQLMSEVARGLQHVHEHSFVHRDVKPSNIMRLRDGSVKIMDFGIARLVEGNSTRLTGTGSIIGTLPYLSPEQFNGANADELSDIWSFGVVYYELICGTDPFHAPSSEAMISRIMSQDPVPLSSVVTGCPRVLSDIIARLLTKERERRYSSCEDVLLDSQPVLHSLAERELPELLRNAEFFMAVDEDRAMPLVRRILDLDPGCAEARRWYEELRRSARKKAVGPRVHEFMRGAEQSAAARNYAQAIQKLDSALRLDPGNTKVQELLDRLRSEQERGQRAAQWIKEARRCLEVQDLTGAFQWAKDAASADPGSAEARELAATVRAQMEDRARTQRIRESLTRANALVQREAYEEATALLQELNRASADSEIPRRLREVLELKRIKEEQARVEAGIKDSRIFLRDGRYRDAIAALERLHRELPANSVISELLEHARNQEAARFQQARLSDFISHSAGAASGGAAVQPAASSSSDAPQKTESMNERAGMLPPPRARSEESNRPRTPWLIAIAAAALFVVLGITGFVLLRNGRPAGKSVEPVTAATKNPVKPPVSAASGGAKPESVESPAPPSSPDPPRAASPAVADADHGKSNPVRSRGAEVHFETNPPSAVLLIDAESPSEKECVSPCTWNLPAGRHTVAASLPGYGQRNRIFLVPEESSIAVNLERVLRTIVVTGPAGDVIILDGERTTSAVPATLRLPPGEHRLQLVRADGSLSESRVLELKDADVFIKFPQ